MPDPLTARARWCLLLAVACALGLGAVYALAVRTAWGQRAGNAAIAGGLDRAPGVVDYASVVLGVVSLPRLAVATAVLVGVGWWRGGWPLALGAGAVVGGANVATQVLKRGVFDRPSLMGVEDPFGSHNSLPSGHATVALSLALAVVLLLPPRRRATVGAPLLAAAVFFGVLTVAAGWHRPSDVMAADLVAVGVASLVAAALLWLGRERGALPPLDRAEAAGQIPLWRRVQGSAAALLGLGLATWLAAVLDPDWNAFEPARTNLAYLAGSVVLWGAGVFLGAAFLAAVAGVDFGRRGRRTAATPAPTA